jgi:hypothetical protein
MARARQQELVGITPPEDNGFALTVTALGIT